MVRSSYLGIIFLVIIILTGCVKDSIVPISESPTSVNNRGITVSRTQILVTFNPGVTYLERADVFESIKAKQIGYISELNIYQIEIPDPGTVNGSEVVVNKLKQNPAVKSATLNSVVDSNKNN